MNKYNFKEISDRIILLLKYFLYLRKLEHKESHKNILLFSSPRGGSTWLANIMTSVDNSTLIWEPLFKGNQYLINAFNPFSYSEIHETNFGWNQHIPENQEWKEAYSFFNRLFRKEIKNIKLYRYNNFKEILSSEIFIYKFCFGNLLLPYLSNNFNIKSVFMLRHPCATISSQLEHGWQYLQKDASYHIPQMKYNSIYVQYKTILDKIRYPEEHLAANWVITNDYLIRHKKNNIDWITVSYEDLYLRKQELINKIFKRLDFKKDQKIDQKVKDVIGEKSFMTNKNTKNFIGDKKQLEIWKSRLKADQQKRIFNILEEFGVDYYSNEIEPDYSIIYNKQYY